MVVDWRAVLNALPRQENRERILILVNVAERMGGQKYQAALQPVSGINHDVANRPRYVVEVKILDMTNFATLRGKLFAVKLLDVD
jgi:hypothetical protein